MTGLVSYHAGKAAEDIVSRAYCAQGFQEDGRRWRGQSGEIDLILSRAGQTVFVEVKQSSSFEAAAQHVTPRQMARVAGAASEFLVSRPQGQNSETRIDVALVDGSGAVEILENVTMH